MLVLEPFTVLKMIDKKERKKERVLTVDYISYLFVAESHTSAQSSKGFMGLSRDMTLLIAGVGGAFLVILIAIICVICFVRKIHKNSTPPANTPVNSRPTSQQEQAEMTSVRKEREI